MTYARYHWSETFRFRCPRIRKQKPPIRGPGFFGFCPTFPGSNVLRCQCRTSGIVPRKQLMKLSLTLEPQQWAYILKLLKRQDQSYTSQLQRLPSVEERHGINTYRIAVCDLAVEIQAALEK